MVAFNPTNSRREKFRASQVVADEATERLIERLYSERDEARARVAELEAALAGWRRVWDGLPDASQ